MKKHEPERGGEAAVPSEAYFTETLGLRRLHIRLPEKDYRHLVTLAGGDRKLRAYISALIQEKWEKWENRSR